MKNHVKPPVNVVKQRLAEKPSLPDDNFRVDRYNCLIQKVRNNDYGMGYICFVNDLDDGY